MLECGAGRGDEIRLRRYVRSGGLRADQSQRDHMTFEQWWASIDVVVESNREIAKRAWSAALTKDMSPFEAWAEMHESECREGRYNRKCFELCWDAAINEVARQASRHAGNLLPLVNIKDLRVNKT